MIYLGCDRVDKGERKFENALRTEVEVIPLKVVKLNTKGKSHE